MSAKGDYLSQFKLIKRTLNYPIRLIEINNYSAIQLFFLK